nr:MAG TPA: hypothetical protein [Caudoviricetes sp.]
MVFYIICHCNCYLDMFWIVGRNNTLYSDSCVSICSNSSVQISYPPYPILNVWTKVFYSIKELIPTFIDFISCCFSRISLIDW